MATIEQVKPAGGGEGGGITGWWSGARTFLTEVRKALQAAAALR